MVTTASPQAVYLEHESWLRTVVRSRLHEPDAVEDVMQNIALAIVKHSEILNKVNRIPAWLYQIAVRQVLMYRRSSGRRRKLYDRVAADPAARIEPPASPLGVGNSGKYSEGAGETSGDRTTNPDAEVCRGLELQRTGQPPGRSGRHH